MLGAIAGDIIGSRFEGHAGPARDFAFFHPQSRFTDDTVCTLAITEALLEARDFAATLRAFVRRYPDAGYGGMFLRWAFSDDMPAYGSWGNGAPMRGSAVGWWAESEAEVLDLAAMQATVSHDHPPALAAAFKADSWENAVRDVVRLGGDTDTLACISGALAEAIFGVPPAIAKQARARLTPELRAVLDRFEKARPISR